MGTTPMIRSKIAGDFPCELAAFRTRIEAGSSENRAAAARERRTGAGGSSGDWELATEDGRKQKRNRENMGGNNGSPPLLVS